MEKYQELKEELERTLKVRGSVVPVVIGATVALTPKLEDRLEQIQKNIRHLGPDKCRPTNSKDTAQSPEASRASGRGPELEGEIKETPPAKVEEELF